MDINDELVHQWEPKLQGFVNKWRIPGVEREDLLQELRIVLVKAARQYDNSRGASFHTYLHRALENSLCSMLSRAKSLTFPQVKELYFGALAQQIDLDALAEFSYPDNTFENLAIEEMYNVPLGLEEKTVLDKSIAGYTAKESGDSKVFHTLYIKKKLRKKFNFLREGKR